MRRQECSESIPAGAALSASQIHRSVRREGPGCARATGTIEFKVGMLTWLLKLGISGFHINYLEDIECQLGLTETEK